MKLNYLSQDQIDEFIENGYIIIREAIPRDVTSKWVDHTFHRLGYDRYDSSTWKQARIPLPNTIKWNAAEFAPKVWAAVLDLMGGEDRVQPFIWGDGFICNLGIGADEPWIPPSPAMKGWHKDGDTFLHFLDSPEQGLLAIVCWTDLIHQGGATFISPDSVGQVAQFLAEHPEGIMPGDTRWREVIRGCSQFIELKAKAGDVVLHHPFMMHSVSNNPLKVERVISNPPTKFKEPMNFNRENPDDFSAVELAVLRGLGVDRYDFKITQPRRRLTPERERIQAKMLEEERARLGAAAINTPR